MVIIKNLEKIPKDVKYGVNKGSIYHRYCDCPCYHDGDQSGPEYCAILVMSKGYFQASPRHNECPLKEVSQD